MKIAITGFSGFVGKNLIDYLKDRNVDILLIDRNKLQNIKAEMFDDGVHAVIHLAGKAHDLKKTASPDEYYQVNSELTKKLYDAFLNSGARKFIFISSVKAAADSLDEVLNENVKPNPQTHYGKSKLLAEEYIISQPLPKGKLYHILRPCMIHGPGNKGNLNLLYKFVKTGIPYPLAGFDNKRSFLSVENLCFVINELIVQEGIDAGVYNVSDDEALSTNVVVATLAASLNLKDRLWKISPGLIKRLAKAGDFFGLPLNTERLHKLTENYVVDNQKIKRAINKNLPLNAIAGLTITFKSFIKKD